MLGCMYAIANILMNGAQHYNIIYIPKNGHLYVTHITFYFFVFVCLFVFECFGWSMATPLGQTNHNTDNIMILETGNN